MSHDIATSVSLGHTDAYVAYNSIRKTLPLGFAGLGFGATGYWMMTGAFGQSWVGWGLGLAAILFFVPMGLGWFWLALDRRKQLVIDAQGLYWRRWSPAIIAWEDITFIEPFSMADNPMLGVGMVDEDKYMPRGLMKVIAGINRRTGFEGMTITMVGVDIDIEGLMAAIQRFAPAPAPDDIDDEDYEDMEDFEY